MDPSVLGLVRLGSGRSLTGLGLSPDQVAFDQRRRIHAGLEAAVADRLRAGRARELSGLAPALSEFALAPYLGIAGARAAAGSARAGENFAAESLK